MNEKGQLFIIQEFLRMVNGHLIDIKQEEYASMSDMWYDVTASKHLTASEHLTFNRRTRKKVNVEVSMEDFSRALEDLRKYHMLMRHPQCRQLLAEAEFIYRLERGNYESYDL